MTTPTKLALSFTMLTLAGALITLNAPIPALLPLAGAVFVILY